MVLAVCATGINASLDNATHARFLNHVPSHVVCPPGYIDHTNGNAFYWTCSAGCPGEWSWGDVQCGCACVLQSECLSRTPKDPCVTRGDMDYRGIAVPARAPAPPAHVQAPAPGPDPEQDNVAWNPGAAGAAPSLPTKAPQAQKFLQQIQQTPAPQERDLTSSVVLGAVVVFGLGVAAFVCHMYTLSTCFSEKGTPMIADLVFGDGPKLSQVHPLPEMALPPPTYTDAEDSHLQVRIALPPPTCTDEKLVEVQPLSAMYWKCCIDDNRTSIASTRTPSPSPSVPSSVSGSPCPSSRSPSPCPSSRSQQTKGSSQSRGTYLRIPPPRPDLQTNGSARRASSSPHSSARSSTSILKQTGREDPLDFVAWTSSKARSGSVPARRS